MGSRSSCRRKGYKKKSSSGVGIVKLKIVMERLLSVSGSKKYYSAGDEGMRVAEDVKEGHFAVMAVDEHDQMRRFIVPLSFLTHPSFLQLLEQAAEEYGFDRDGALTLPCNPTVLHRILHEETPSTSTNHKCHWGGFMQSK